MNDFIGLPLTKFETSGFPLICSFIVSLVSYLGIAAIGILGAIYAISGTMTVGNLQAFIRYICMANKSTYFSSDSTIIFNTICLCSNRTCI